MGVWDIYREVPPSKNGLMGRRPFKSNLVDLLGSEPKNHRLTATALPRPADYRVVRH